MHKIQDIHTRVPVASRSEEKIEKINNKSLFRNMGLVLLVIALFGLAVYGYIHYKHGKEGDVTMILVEVGRLVDLPQGETPTIATVTDLKPLGSQEFFKDAQIGDKLLLFTRSKRAILYRPSTKKIIVVAPLNN
ncbi:hypothetical protein BH11PAT3_BH11PAT3_2920 [soil metagenome]